MPRAEWVYPAFLSILTKQVLNENSQDLYIVKWEKLLEPVNDNHFEELLLEKNIRILIYRAENCHFFETLDQANLLFLRV